MNRTFIGIDLGTINDFTAVAVVQRYGEQKTIIARGDRPVVQEKWRFKEYRVLHLERYLGEPYTAIVEKIRALLERPELKGSRLVVDGTGVGRPVIDLLVEKGLQVTPIIITGGSTWTEDVVNGQHEYRVPKRDLVGVLQVLLQNRQLKIPGSIDLKDQLVTEMQNFKVKLNAETGHASFEHWRSSDHDDLVLAVALPCWLMERPIGFKPVLM
ncbi:MAG: hypothetical protein WD021_11100 [Rhodothermales bacterium]